MGFFAIVNCFALRFKLSVAIVAMVNLTYVREYDAAAQRLWNSSDVGSSRYHSDDLCVTADENTTDVDDDNVRIIDMGGATDFKVGGTKQDSRAERQKKLYPHFSKCGGYKQANISRALLNILKFAVWLSH